MNVFVASLFKKYFGVLAVLLNILNVFDATITLHWVTNNIAQEANPLMDFLISQSPWLFVSIKILLVGLGTWLLLNYRQSRASWAAISCCLIVYVWIMFIHFQIYADTLAFLSQT